MNIPNMLTVLRIAMIPVMVALFYIPYRWAGEASAIVFALAALTDWVDGFLARLWKQTTPLGAFLDPVADKLIVSVALVLLAASFATPWVAIPAAVIIGREIAVSALREWMAEFGKRATVKVSWLGKCKTTFQMIAIFLLLWAPRSLGEPWTWVGLGLLYIAAVLTLWSMLQYLKAAWKEGSSAK